MRHADLTANRRNVHNPAIAPLFHAGQDRQCRIECTPENDRHRSLEILDRHVLRRTDLNDTRVVHEDIDTPILLLDAPDHLLDLLLVREVALYSYNFNTSS